jgi:hypothetical protein
MHSITAQLSARSNRRRATAVVDPVGVGLHRAQRAAARNHEHALGHLEVGLATRRRAELLHLSHSSKAPAYRSLISSR